MELHIVSFDIPFPANYGGVIDVYSKLKALSQNQVKIHLHCFEYGRKEAKELESLCQVIHYYKRNTGFSSHLSTLPYIVKSRSNIQLLKNLTAIEAPILFEGIHSTYFLNHPNLESRVKWVRLHNIEHIYYSELASAETNMLHKLYFQIESLKLKSYQKKLIKATGIASISRTETTIVQDIHPNTHWVPAFYQTVNKPSSLTKDYFLFNGDFTINTNQKAARELVQGLDKNIHLYIAGKMNHKFQSSFENRYPNIRCIANPNDQDMTTLMCSARGHILYANHGSGVKLKLLHALATGAPVFANVSMLEGSALEKEIKCFRDISELPKLIRSADVEDYKVPASFGTIYNNQNNAKTLINLIFNDQ